MFIKLQEKQKKVFISLHYRFSAASVTKKEEVKGKIFCNYISLDLEEKRSQNFYNINLVFDN